MKTISTLVPDILNRLKSGEPFDKQDVESFATGLARQLADRLATDRERPRLRLSNLGTRCARKLWYSINRPELAEPLSGPARLKFLVGDIVEGVVLFLAKAAGHTVEKEQAEVEIAGVKGHIDAVIDGELVDVKSASTPSFKKFKSHGLQHSDDFGYRDQLGAYRTALGLDRGHFLAVDKTLGSLTLDTHTKEEYDQDYERLVADRREMLANPEPPPRGYSDKPDGASGNRRLDLACSYCPFKLDCWPGVRGFGYSRGPVFLTQVVRVPDVPELTLGHSEKPATEAEVELEVGSD